MGLSWHNFFFGAFEPGGSVSIDKPPVDLWLQVASVKLFGFTSTTLKLPEAFAGIAAVPLLFAAVRRMWSVPAGIAAATAMAVLPVEVITSRSDTMDAVMMALIVLALLLIVCARRDRQQRLAAGRRGRARPGVRRQAARVARGAAGTRGARLPRAAGQPAADACCRSGWRRAVYVVVALAWLTATLIAPAHDRPYAIGSTNGSAWNAAFVFNGTDRLGGKSPEPQFTVYEPGHRYPDGDASPSATTSRSSPSPTRLLARIGPLSGERLGLELLVALLLGIPALLWGLGREPGRARPRSTPGRRPEPRAAPRERSRPAPALRAAPAGPPRAVDAHRDRAVQRHGAPAPRYVEGFTPAVAAMLGIIGVAWAALIAGPLPPGVLAGASRCGGGLLRRAPALRPPPRSWWM